MTVKEIAEKHGIPYYVVYGATYLIQPIRRRSRGSLYDEKELLTALRKDMAQKRDIQSKRLEKTLGMLEHINKELMKL